MDIIKQQASSALTDFDKGTEKMYVLAIDLRSQLSSEYTYVKAMFHIGSFYARWANNPLMLVQNFTHSNVQLCTAEMCKSTELCSETKRTMLRTKPRNKVEEKRLHKKLDSVINVNDGT